VRMPRRGRQNGNVLGNSEEERGGRLVQLRPKTKEIDQAMSEYLMYFRRVMKANRWGDFEAGEVFPALIDPKERTLDSLEGKWTTFSELEILLRNLEEPLRDSKLEDFVRLTFDPSSESVSSFQSKIINFVSVLYPDLEKSFQNLLARDNFLMKLPNELRSLVLAGRPKEFEDVVAITASCVSSLRDKGMFAIQDEKPCLDPECMIVERGNTICSKCHRVGHVEWNCSRGEASSSPRKEVRCYGCGKFGHIRRYCKSVEGSKKKLIAAVLGGANTEAMSRLQKGDDRFVVRGEVDGNECGILLDSGAVVSVVRRDVVGKFGWRPSGLRLRAANGTAMQIQGVKICQVRVGKLVKSIRCCVVEDLSVPCIIGVDGLRILGVTMKFAEDSLEVDLGAIELGQVDIGSTGGKRTEEAVMKLVRKYEEIFGAVVPGAAKGVEHAIHVTREEPVVCRGRRVPLNDQILIEEHVKEMLSDGVISPSTSGSPVVLATKKDGKRRFCVNFCRLNDRTVKNRYPLPNVDDLIDRTHGSKVFSVLDQSSAYWQISMRKEDREKTAFSTSSGHYQFNVMPFGLCNAPATQQEFMKGVLSGMKGVDVLLDDIIIHTADVKSHLQLLEEVFKKLREKNLRLKMSKCHLLQDSIKYLGYIISGKGREVDPEKTKAIDDYPAPRTVRELRTFLGMATYCGKFIKGYAAIASPL